MKVTSVEDGSQASAQGVSVGSVILQVAGESVLGLKQSDVKMRVKEAERPVTFLLQIGEGDVDWHPSYDIVMAQRLVGSSVMRMATCVGACDAHAPPAREGAMLHSAVWPVVYISGEQR